MGMQKVNEASLLQNWPNASIRFDAILTSEWENTVVWNVVQTGKEIYSLVSGLVNNSRLNWQINLKESDNDRKKELQWRVQNVWD